MIFYNEKTPFPAIRKIRSKSRKIDIFQKGLTHRLGPKMAIFPSFFFGNIAQENVPYDILQRKNAFQGYKKKKYKKVQKLTFFQSLGVNPWFWSKNHYFSTFFFQGNIGQENVVYDILEQKKRLSRPKTRSSKSEKIDVFPKGLTHAFGPKVAIFCKFFFQAIQARKMSFTIFQNKKTPFQAVKTRSLKSRKIDIFPWNCSKNGYFSRFFIGNIAQKMSFKIFQNENTPFQAIKAGSSKTRKNVIFGAFLTSFFLLPRKVFFPFRIS